MLECLNQEQKELLEKKLQELVGKTIRFNKNARKSEIDLDTGMLAVVTGYSVDDDMIDSETCESFKLELDWSNPKILSLNESLMKPDYYDGNGNPCIKWNETKSYPQDHKASWYFTSEWLLDENLMKKHMEFEVVEDEIQKHVNLKKENEELKAEIIRLKEVIQSMHEDAAGPDI